jgi:hypothetical protein
MPDALELPIPDAPQPTPGPGEPYPVPDPGEPYPVPDPRRGPAGDGRQRFFESTARSGSTLGIFDRSGTSSRFASA